MGTRDLLFIGLVIGGATALGASLYPRRLPDRSTQTARVAPVDPSLRQTVASVDASFRSAWEAGKIQPARPADWLTVARRISLAMTGSTPSLEEIRSLERLPDRDRLNLFLNALLNDRRASDYLAERLARAYVGTEGGPFVIFRRRRFVTWLSDQLHDGRPYDQIVRDLIASDGIWTDRPATNFITVTYDPERKVVDPERLAVRVSRSFLGSRMDCARCHDHPFADWKLADFQGLAAFFGKAESGLRGIHEGDSDYKPTDRKGGKEYTVEPKVPFHPELLPVGGNRRQRLAAWVTHPKNEAFSRATVNRVWALMFGRPLVDPVDDALAAEETPEALAILADDFARHGFDLRRLIRAVAATEVFRLDSAAEPEPTEEAVQAWAVFPLTPAPARAGRWVARPVVLDDDRRRVADPRPAREVLQRVRLPQALRRLRRGRAERPPDHDPATAPAHERSAAGADQAGPVQRRLSHRLVRPRRSRGGRGRLLDGPGPVVRQPRNRPGSSRGSPGSPAEGGERMSDLIWTLVNATEFSWNH
ncbi:MAG: DUF1549 domain-containing protein [Isosphaeraceae bacterium]